MTHKQRAFAIEYLKDRIATQAAIRAGYSKDTAYSQGQRLLKNDEIAQYIKEQTEEALGDSQQDMIDNRNLWKRIIVDPEATNAEKMKASELLGKYRGMFVEKKEIGVSGGLEITVSRRSIDEDNN